MISWGGETKHPSFSTAESATEKRNSCITAQAAGGSIITSLGVSSLHTINTTYGHMNVSSQTPTPLN
jgi:hypothetical protein